MPGPSPCTQAGYPTKNRIARCEIIRSDEFYLGFSITAYAL